MAVSDGVGTLDDRMTSLRGDVARLDGEVGWTQMAVSDGVGTLDDRMTSLRGDVARLDGEVGWTQMAVSDGVWMLDDRMTSLRGDVARLDGEVGWTQMAVSDGVGMLDEQLSAAKLLVVRNLRNMTRRMRGAAAEIETTLHEVNVCVREVQTDNGKKAYNLLSCRQLYSAESPTSPSTGG